MFSDYTFFTDIEQEKVKTLIYNQQIRCLVRDKYIPLTPEEIVRQLFISHIIHQYGYDITDVTLEYSISFGRQSGRADIVILESESIPFIIVEIKKLFETNGIDQLKSYMIASGAKFGVWCNGKDISFLYYNKEKNSFSQVKNIPKKEQIYIVVPTSVIEENNAIQSAELSYSSHITKNLPYGIIPKNKSLTLLFSFFGGVIGLHKFYLNDKYKWAYLFFCWTYIPFFLSTIDFFRILIMSTEEFEKTYYRKIYY